MKKILVIEDEPEMRRNLTTVLRLEKFRPLPAENGRIGVELAKKEKPDLILCDVMMPELDGYGVLQALRDNPDTASIPFIFLTAKGEKIDVRSGMNLGADDYLTKPVAKADLLNAIRTRLQRAAQQARPEFNPDFSSAKPLEKALDLTPRVAETLLCGDVTVVTQQAKVYKNGREVLLTALEYRLLLVLVSNQGRVLTRSQILGSIWDVDDDFVNDNTLTVYIKRLREKLEDDPQNPALIKTVRGLGYTVGD